MSTHWVSSLLKVACSGLGETNMQPLGNKPDISSLDQLHPYGPTPIYLHCIYCAYKWPHDSNALCSSMVCCITAAAHIFSVVK